MIDQPKIERARAEICAIAQQMLAGTFSYIEGARAIIDLMGAANIDHEFDDDFRAMIGIDSETDAFPFGKVREIWNREALARLQPEIDEAEKWARAGGGGETACRRIIARFATAEIPDID